MRIGVGICVSLSSFEPLYKIEHSASVLRFIKNSVFYFLCIPVGHALSFRIRIVNNFSKLIRFRFDCRCYRIHFEQQLKLTFSKRKNCCVVNCIWLACSRLVCSFILAKFSSFRIPLTNCKWIFGLLTSTLIECNITASVDVNIWYNWISFFNPIPSPLPF